MMSLADKLKRLDIHSPAITVVDTANAVTDAIGLDGGKMTNKKDSLEEIYNKLGFSEYLPHANYDGLEDLLNPKAWTQQSSLSMCIEEADVFLEHEDTAREILEIFAEMALIWNDSGKPFSVKLQTKKL